MRRSTPRWANCLPSEALNVESCPDAAPGELVDGARKLGAVHISMRGPDANAKDLGDLGDPCELRRHERTEPTAVPGRNSHRPTTVVLLWQSPATYMKEVFHMSTVIEPIGKEAGDG